MENFCFRKVSRENMKLSIFTTMTDPEKRMDPWKEALSCYEDVADEVISVGSDWPQEFSFELIGEKFQEGFNESSGDWVIHMDIDNFFHEKDLFKIRDVLIKNPNSPSLAFPKYQIFTPDRFNLKAKMCIALNKRKFPHIKMNGGGDLCQPTIDNKLISPKNVPYVRIPIWNYDTVFRTKDIIAEDRARFARAWHRSFKDWGDRGGGNPEEAYIAWFEMVQERYKNHVRKLSLEDHPKYIKNKISNLNETQFGYDGFGLKEAYNISKMKFLKSNLNFYYNNYFS